jgi:hypothetical protein
MNLPAILDKIIHDVQQYDLLIQKLSSDKLVDNMVEEFLRLREAVQYVESKLDGRIESLTYNINLLNKKFKRRKYFSKKEINESNENLIDLALYLERANTDFYNSEKTNPAIKSKHIIFLEKTLELKKILIEYNNTASIKLLTLNEAHTQSQLKESQLNKTYPIDFLYQPNNYQ